MRDTRNRSPPRPVFGERGSGGEGDKRVEYPRHSCVSNTRCPSALALLSVKPLTPGPSPLMTGERGARIRSFVRTSIRMRGLTSQMPHVSSTKAFTSGEAAELPRRSQIASMKVSRQGNRVRKSTRWSSEVLIFLSLNVQ